MMNILVVSGHPHYMASHANKAILDEFHSLVPEAELVRLAELYPDFKIDVQREQKRLVDAGTLIFEFPFWWFGYPSILHRYVEDVFTYGFAYGSKGQALKGKEFIISFTTGAPESEYSATGAEGYPMEAFLPPILELGNFTGMVNRGAVISYGMAVLDERDQQAMAAMLEKARKHASRLAALVRQG